MSRQIVNDHLFTEDEVRYLQARNQWKLVQANKIQFGSKDVAAQPKPVAVAKKVELPPKAKAEAKIQFTRDVFEHVKGLSKEDLTKELEANGLSLDGTERDQRITLATHLQEKRNRDRS